MENTNFVKRNLLFVLISFIMMIFSCSGVRGYGENYEMDPSDYLTFTAGDNPVTVTLNSGFGDTIGDPATRAEIQYTSSDPITPETVWTTFDPNSSITIKAKSSIKLRGHHVNTSGMNQSLFTFDNYVSASGYVDSLRLEDDYSRFLGLVWECYKNMFNGCDKLITAPKLGCDDLTVHVGDTTEEASGCYNQMFKDCKLLQGAPDLPAKKLANSCYAGMFNGCENLKYPPNIAAETLAGYCYGDMFKGCTNLKLSVDGLGDESDSYPYSWTFKGFDSKDNIQSTNPVDYGTYWSMFDIDSFPSDEILYGRPNLNEAEIGNDGRITLFSKYPQWSNNASQVVQWPNSDYDSQDTLVAYVKVGLSDGAGDGNYIVEDDPTIDDDGNISDMELKWEDESGNVSSIDSLDENSHAYITIKKKQDGSYVASSKLFTLRSEYGKVIIPSQQLFSGYPDQAAPDAASQVWNDKTPAVYNVFITVVNA